MRIAAETRFLNRLAPPNEFGCQLWIGAISGTGYGSFVITTNEKIAPHVYAYKRVHGEHSSELHVCHNCDQFYGPGDITYRRCCTESHLCLGTRSENIQHMVDVGRSGSKYYSLPLIITCPMCNTPREVSRLLALRYQRKASSGICRSCAGRLRIETRMRYVA